MSKRLENIGVDYIYLRPVEEAGDITPSLESLLDLRKKLAELTADTRIKYMLAISDRVVDKNAGLPCISVLWGFRDKAFLTGHGAKCFVEKPMEITDVLKRMNQ